MHIVLIMDPFIRVPPQHYGGIERVIADIADIYVKAGHEVTLIAAPGSVSPDRLIPFGKEGVQSRMASVRHWWVATRILRKEVLQADVIHNFGRLAYLLGLGRVDCAKVQTYMRPVRAANIRSFLRLRPRRMLFTAVSNFITRGGRVGGGDWQTIYNCARIDQYLYCPDVDPTSAPLVFLGRIERCKGLHSAIRVAGLAGRKLIVAGNLSALPHEKAYFDQEIAPLIDGEKIVFVGTVDNDQKNRLLGSAAAMLLPIEWDEPFPVVLPEALLCGAPVIAFRRGGVPEGITEGKTGFVCDTVEEMAACVQRLPELSRIACRQEAEARFSATLIAESYLENYDRLRHKVT